MELLQIDDRIKECNTCGCMVEKFENNTTVQQIYQVSLEYMIMVNV